MVYIMVWQRNLWNVRCFGKGYLWVEKNVYVISFKGAVALISAQLLFLCKKITARPRKNPAVGVKSSYATN